MKKAHEMTPDELKAVLDECRRDSGFASRLLYDWRGFWARPEQMPPDDFLFWLYKAGRGAGKTRAGAEWVREIARQPGLRIAMVAPTAADIRDVMIEGSSGILSISPPWDMPVYEPSKRHRLTWKNGTMAFGFSSEEPDRLRGPQFHKAWCDELAAWTYLDRTWDMLQFGVRLGNNPQILMTTTPKPNPLMIRLMKDEKVIVSNGSTYDNKSNLADGFFREIIKQYEGTRLGRQELEGELIEDVDGALWTSRMIEESTISLPRGAKRHGVDAIMSVVPEMQRIVVAVDPSGASNKRSKSDEIGISVAGVCKSGNLYILDDLSILGSPYEWAGRAIQAYHAFGADRIVAETNFGGGMVEAVIRGQDSSVSFSEVKASRGKSVRAEPVAAIWERGMARMVGTMPELAAQMTAMTAAGYVGDGSPDRLDAMVWAGTDLCLKKKKAWNNYTSGIINVGSNKNG